MGVQVAAQDLELTLLMVLVLVGVKRLLVVGVGVLLGWCVLLGLGGLGLLLGVVLGVGVLLGLMGMLLVVVVVVGLQRS